MLRKDPLVTDEIYHVMNKSIVGFRIFNHPADYERMINLMWYFTLVEPPAKFSYFLNNDPGVSAIGARARIAELIHDGEQHVQIIAYCLMPTHFHIVVKQLEDDGISEFLRKTSNGYARYFNTRYKRKGALWMSRYKNVLVETDEQLLHLTRYLHLNPYTAKLTEKINEWPYSSYQEYVNPGKVIYPITDHEDFIDMAGKEYRQFCVDQAAYQRDLAIIKKQILE